MHLFTQNKSHKLYHDLRKLTFFCLSNLNSQHSSSCPIHFISTGLFGFLEHIKLVFTLGTLYLPFSLELGTQQGLLALVSFLFRFFPSRPHQIANILGASHYR